MGGCMSGGTGCVFVCVLIKISNEQADDTRELCFEEVVMRWG